MQFVQNKISVGKGKNFDDIVKDYMDKKNASVKTASTASPAVKTAEKEEGVSSGQLDVEPLHQTGESTNQDSINKDDKGSKGSAKKVEKDEEGKDSGQPKAEAKLTNDPKVEEKKANASFDKFIEEKKEEAKDKKDGKEECGCDKEKDEDKKDEKKEEKDASSKSGFKKIANLTPSEKTRLAAYWKNLYPAEFVDAMLAEK